MNIDQAVFRFAGAMILISLLLVFWHSSLWLWFTAFIGFNLLQASFTGFCPIAKLFLKLGLKPGALFSQQNERP